ncbi:MAG: 3,4-dihydroxy-2-butanone-4-phosphate synthase [Candidatus Micrarchaeota archaeon]
MTVTEEAAAMLRKGGMIVVYDGDEREGEADLMFHALFASAGNIERLRRDAGGLICVAVSQEIAERLDLPFYTDILAGSDSGIKEMECTKTAYKDRPAFAIPVNHKGVYTGITDNDRSLTITKMAELAKEGGDIRKRFVDEFYSPGHVFLLRGSGIEKRKGHTELSLELAKMAGISGVMVLCEMLGSGKALPKEKAREYAEKNGFIFLEGREVYG